MRWRIHANRFIEAGLRWFQSRSEIQLASYWRVVLDTVVEHLYWANRVEHCYGVGSNPGRVNFRRSLGPEGMNPLPDSLAKFLDQLRTHPGEAGCLRHLYQIA